MRFRTACELPKHLRGKSVTIKLEELRPSTAEELIETLAAQHGDDDLRVKLLKTLWDEITTEGE